MGDPSLEKTVEECKISETTRAQAKEIQKDKEINYVNSRNWKVNKQEISQNNKSNQQYRTFGVNDYQHKVNNGNVKKGEQNGGQRCGKCNGVHQWRKCPAYGATCNKCNKRNHYAKCCKSKQVQEVSDFVIDTIENYIDKQDSCNNFVRNFENYFDKNIINDKNGKVNCNRIDNESINKSSVIYNVNNAQVSFPNLQWTEKIKVDNTIIDFKLDSGAGVNLITEIELNRINSEISLERTNVGLRAYGGIKIPVLGSIYLNLKWKNMVYKEPFIVVDLKATPILGRETCQKLGLIKRIFEITKSDKEGFINSNIEIFKGLGKFPLKLDLKIKENAQPVISISHLEDYL